MDKPKMICIDCGEEKDKSCFSGRQTHCLKCHYLRYGKKRKHIKVVCPNCNKEKNMRSDAYKIRKSDMCSKCSLLFNKQLFVSDHGLDISHPLYRRWTGMIRRCKDPKKANSYLNKGIAVCDEWKDYKNFYEWSIENGFNESLELDRIDEDKGYSPDNCQWITHYENTKKIKKLFGRDT